MLRTAEFIFWALGRDMRLKSIVVLENIDVLQ